MRFARADNIWKIEGAAAGAGCLESMAYEEGYRVDGLCEMLGCSQRHLYDLFMRDIGLPPRHWLDMERMVVARRKLRGGRMIKEVAGELGYSSVVAFTRRFEKVHGMPPGRYARDVSRPPR